MSDQQQLVRTVLRMRAREGCERAFEAAMRESAVEISRMPGNVRQELIRDASDGRTFLITSDWTNREALDAFGHSAARDRLTAALRDLRESAERHTYEVLQTIAGRGPRIRVVVTVTVEEGEEEAYEQAYLKVAERMRGTAGHVREELLREPGTRTYHLFAEWEDEPSFEAWANDPSHMDKTAPLMSYLLASFERKTYHIVGRPDEFRQPAQATSQPVEAMYPEPVRATNGLHGNRSTGSAPTRQRDTPVHVPVPPNGKAPSGLTSEILVVGAGPTGLTVAIELARRGVACRIIDKRAEPAMQADKAIGIHCRTMEIWEDMGIVREAMDTGIWLHGQTVFVNGQLTHQIDWDLPELPYAHLGLPQYETERLLTARLAELGVSIERNVELQDLTQDNDGVTSRLVTASGELELARTEYVVGCDGAQSAVRKSLGLAFEGGLGMFPQLFMLGDVALDWSMPEGHLLRFVQLEDGEMRGMLVCVPLRGPGRYRVATLAPPRLQAEIGSGPVPPGFWREYTPPTLSDIQAVLDHLAPAGTTARNMRWSSIFRIKHGIVDRYRMGRVFVAGDAAHLHPPAGGQGMNTGIQDAWNLGWKLGLAVRGRASPDLLDSYEAERRPAGKEIVDRAVRVAFTDEIDIEDEKRQFLTDMQMTLTYAGSPLVGEELKASGPLRCGPAPGDRAPDAHGLRRFGVGHPLRLFDLTRGTAHTLLLAADASVGEEEMIELSTLAGRMRELAGNLLNTYLIVSPDAHVPVGLDIPVLRDARGEVRSAYDLAGASAHLVRPDGHVAFRCSPVADAGLQDHLGKMVGVHVVSWS